MDSEALAVLNGVPDDAPPSAKFVADARFQNYRRESDGWRSWKWSALFEKALVQIPTAEHEPTSHPEPFLKLLRPCDLALGMKPIDWD